MALALSDMPVVVGPDIISLLTADRPCIASITAWMILEMPLEVKVALVGVEEAKEETMVIDILRLFNNWVDHNKGDKVN